jgi:tRNA G18 (ribose-2'-O)-methylase SpoU
MHTTATNPLLGAYRDVGDPAALERAGLFVVEGRLVVQRLIEDQRFRIHSIAVTPPARRALAATLDQRPDVPLMVCEPAELQAITGFDFHRGCLALAWRHDTRMAIDELAAATRILAIEGVGNPDNIGGLFRSALALGAESVMLDAAAADPLYRKAIRTSMGATLRVPYCRASSWPGDLAALRQRGFRVLALTPGGNAVRLSEVRVDPATQLVLMVGAEGPGLTPSALAHADAAVRIPVDPRADSLNVVVAASIALHALRYP